MCRESPSSIVRNPVWKASTDPVRKAYVNRIDVSETGNQQAIQEQLETNTAAADMGWDTQVPSSAIPALLSSKNPNLVLGPSYGTNPYIVFNQVSPNNGGALANVQVRQALEYGINRTDLVQDDGGPQVSPAAHPRPAAGDRRLPELRSLSLQPAEGQANAQAVAGRAAI